MQAQEALGSTVKYSEYLKQAQQYENNNDFEKAIEYYSSAQQLNPGDATCIQKIEYCRKKINDKKTELLVKGWLEVSL